MSSFFRDYLYESVKNSLRGGVYFHLLIVFVAIGFWHGSGWNFIVYGFCHGTFVWLEHWQKTRRANAGLRPVIYQGWRVVVRVAQTFTLVAMTRILFRGNDLSSAWEYAYAMLTNGWGEFPVTVLSAALFGAALALHFTPMRWRDALMQWISGQHPIRYAMGAVATVYLLIAFGGDNAAFIYFQF